MTKSHFACALFLACALVARAQTPRGQDEDAKTVLALESAWNQAEMKADAPALRLLLADTFRNTDEDGSFADKAQWLARIKSGSDHYEQLSNQNQEVQVYGSAAVVTGEYREKMRSNAKTITRKGRFTDVWVKMDGVWKCVASHATLIAP
jgi:ketosteroid isomerase-like protein